MKASGWRFDRISSTVLYFHETTELKGSNLVKNPLTSISFLNIEKNDKNCFNWSILATLHPCENSHPNRVSIYRQYFNDLEIQGFDFSYRIKCSDVYLFEKLNNPSINILELSFYQDQNKWKYELIPIEMSKNNSERIVDF